MKWVLKTLVSCNRKKKYRPRAGVVIANPGCIQGITNVNVTMTQNIQSSLKSRPAIFVRTESDGLDYAYAKH